jgi:lipopolysaccharide/colanic/teichoic acid biosynthesis glycosyltransferase
MSNMIFTTSTDLSRTPKQIQAILVPKAREPWLKRPLDVTLSSLMLILSAPVSLLIALAIKLEDGGPIFYRQERWGRGGVRFKAYKFRTMVPHSDRVFGIKQATENDARITRVGRVLRAMGLDELPQMISIFRGEMSLVGPRALAVGEILQDEKGRRVAGEHPAIPALQDGVKSIRPDHGGDNIKETPCRKAPPFRGESFTYEEIPDFWKRLSVRPGLTGVTTIYKPKDISPRKKFRYDLLYIRKQSFWLDLRLILMSFLISFRGKWEQREKKW